MYLARGGGEGRERLREEEGNMDGDEEEKGESSVDHLNASGNYACKYMSDKNALYVIKSLNDIYMSNNF